MHNTIPGTLPPARRNQLDVLEDMAAGIGALVEAGGGPGGMVDFEILLVSDANDVVGIRRETNTNGTVAITYETLSGAVWVPAMPLKLLTPALPAGAATIAGQTTGNNSLASIDTKVTGLATQATLAAILAKVIANPATDTLQTAGNTSLASILTRANLLAADATVTAMSAKLPASLGAKAGAASVSLVPATDAIFQNAARYNTTLPTYTNGQSAELQTDPRGGLYVTVASGGTVALITDNSADGRAATSIGLTTRSFNYVYNGATWDRALGDVTGQSVNIVKRPLVARQLAASSASAQTALTSGVKRVSMYARGTDIRYALANATGVVAVNTTSHFIAAGERLDIDVGSIGTTPFIAVIRDSLVTADGTLELSELS